MNAEPARRAEDGGSAPDVSPLLRILIVVRRRWKISVTVFLLTLGYSALKTFSQPKIFRPQATLEIRPERNTVTTSGEGTEYTATYYFWDSYFLTQQNILSSRALAESAIKALPPALRAEFEGPGGAQAFAGNVDLEPVRASFVLRVGFPDRDPDKSTQIVNTLVSVYLEDANRRIRDLRSNAADKLTNETLPDIRKAVVAAEQEMGEFQAKTGCVDFEEQYEDLLAGWKSARERLREVRLLKIRLDAQYQSLTAYGSDGATGLYHPSFHQTKALESLGQERARIAAEISAQARALKDNHPRMQELRAQMESVEVKIREAVQGTLVALKTDLQAAAREEESLTLEAKQLADEMAQTATNLNVARRLSSELTSAKELYASYLKRQGETSATAGTGLQSVRVIEPAKFPTGPWKPDRSQGLALGAMVGLMLAGISTLVAEQLDNRILSADEVRAFVGLEVLAGIPKLKAAGGEGVFVLGDDASIPDMEAFRGLRAQVVTRLERLGRVQAGQAPVVSVLSAFPGEGKTTVAANLARALALEGRRVLLFDADLRKPRLHGLLDGPRGPGLEDVLAGRADLKSAARPSRIKGVDIVGVRAGMSSAAELSSSPRFAEAVRAARELYDFVILDSAPVIHASESALIARRADAAVLVVREGKTGRGTARAAKDALADMGVSVLGAVLNMAGTRGRGYGYGYGYGYGPAQGTDPAAGAE